MVPPARFELACLSADALEATVYPVPPRGHLFILDVGPVGVTFLLKIKLW